MKFNKLDMALGRDTVKGFNVAEFCEDLQTDLNIVLDDALKIAEAIKNATGTRAAYLYRLAANASGWSNYAAVWALTWFPELSAKYLKPHGFNVYRFICRNSPSAFEGGYSRKKMTDAFGYRTIQYYRDIMQKNCAEIKENKSAIFKHSSILNGRFRTSPPLSYGEWVSAEIECYIPLKELAPKITDADRLLAKSGQYNDRCPERECIRRLMTAAGVLRFDVKLDGSVHPNNNEFPVELTISINRASGYENLRRMTDVLATLGARVNSTCGLHVHVDMRKAITNDADKRKISGRYKSALPFLLSMVHESRRNNRFCRPKLNKWRGSRQRYVAVNLMAYAEHKTVEIRLHSGTTNFEKIKNWCELVYRIGRFDYTGTFKTFQDFIDKLQLDESLIEYIERRQALFNGKDYLEKCETMGDWVDNDNDDVLELFREKKEILQYRAEFDALAASVAACGDLNDLGFFRESLLTLLSKTQKSLNFSDISEDAIRLRNEADLILWAAGAMGEDLKDFPQNYERMNVREAREAFAKYNDFKIRAEQTTIKAV